MLSQLGWAAGSSLLAAGASPCLLRLLQATSAAASAAAGQASSRRHRPFSTSTASAHAETKEGRQEPADRAVASAKQHLKDFAKLPWELDMPHDKAAAVLGSYLGVNNLEPAAVLDLDVDQITGILEETTNKGNRQLEKALFSHADAVSQRFFGDAVYYRGICEFSNVCTNDCGYCGIRKHQKGVRRYTMPVQEVVDVSRWTFENGMGTIMLQAGELDTPARLAYLEEIVSRVVAETRAMDLERQGLDPQGPVPEGLGELGLRV